MKKWITALLLLIIIILAGIYVFIPSELKINKAIMVSANQNAAFRSLISKEQWNKWWPGEPGLIYKDRAYALYPSAVDATGVVVSDGKKKISTVVKIYPVATDSLAIQWQFEMPISSNPFQRVRDYTYGKNLGHDINNLLAAMKEYMQVPQNLYGFDVSQTKVTDTLLVATRTEINHYPHTDDVYRLVGKLRKYISSQNAKETNHPMLHINEIDSAHYQYMVALPVDKALPGKGDIQMKRMVPGNILVAEIKGGEATINHALTEFDNLVSDYKKTSPAIPFQLLVTDRMEVRDTSRWITKLYYPIF